MTASCCHVADGDDVTVNKPNYSHRGLYVLFPVTFFSIIVGITFLSWPGAFDTSNGQVSRSLVVGVIFSCMAVLGAISLTVLICYIHCSSFQRATLPHWSIDYSRFTENKSKDSVTSPSQVQAPVEDNSNNIRLKELKQHSKPKTYSTPPRSRNSIRPILETHYETLTDSDIKPNQIDNSPIGVDNSANTAMVDVHRSLSTDSTHTMVIGETTLDGASGNDVGYSQGIDV